jgi:DNA-binding response OmpR family regulator
MSRILIVEDDRAIGVALEDDLRLEGYDVQLVVDGDVAVRTARETGFDLVLLDVMLPKKDGFEVCRELRRSGVDSKILLLTARTGETDKVLGLDLGADEHCHGLDAGWFDAAVRQRSRRHDESVGPAIQ